MQDPIITPSAFFTRVVTPDCQDVVRSPHDVRLVFHACTSLHHLKEWLFQAGITGFPTQQSFNTDLNARCPALVTIRDLAVNAKHFPPTSAEAMEVGVSAATLGYGMSGYGGSQYGSIQQNQVLAKTLTGREEWVIPIITQAFTFWQSEFKNNKW